MGDASSYYIATATLEAESHASVLARTTGVVRELRREEGDHVRAGDVLLLLEDEEENYRFQQAEANLRSAQAEHDRRKSMLENGLLSAEEFETTLNTLTVRKAELGLARTTLAYTRVKAPFTGRVVRRHVDRGANVTPGTPLFDVMDDDPLLARVHIPAKRMGFVEIGQAMEIHVDSDNTDLVGIVRLISPIVDATTGTVKVTAEILDAPTGTRPGDFAQVRIVTERHSDVSLVPSVAVFEDQSQQVVYVVEGGVAHRRVVETGFVDGDDTEITSGLAPGEVIVVKGQRQLRDGGGVELLEGPDDILAEEALRRADPEEGEGVSAEAASAEGGSPGKSAKGRNPKPSDS